MELAKGLLKIPFTNTNFGTNSAEEVRKKVD